MCSLFSLGGHFSVAPDYLVSPFKLRDKKSDVYSGNQFIVKCTVLRCQCE